MNKKLFMVAISTLALVGQAPAYADSMQPPVSQTGSVKEDMKEAWQDMKHDAQEAKESFEAFFLSEDEAVPAKKVAYARISSATGMIGSPVINYKNERVGTVKDIIVNKDGEADMLVIADGEFPGFDGKLVAYNYSDVFKKDAEGDVLAPISENMINRAAEFSYTPDTGKSMVRNIPEGGYSVEKILKGDVLNSNDEKVGSVEDIYFKGGRADLVIIGFDKVLGMGGSKVAANYQPADIIFDGDSLHVELTAQQSVALSNYKKATSK